MYLNKLAKRASVTLVMSLLCFFAFAQGRKVSGTVKDETGESMIGVNILIKGTTNGTITDVNGNFSLSGVIEKATLVVSYIGYEPKSFSVGNQSVFNIVLKSNAQNLDEVVVIGYGTVKKSDLTGSVGSVGTDKLVAKGSTTVMESLQGQVAGVDISQSSSRAGESFNIQIRGKSSLEGGSPLYVVDGVVSDNINFLNPADIERIDILKDASSTAIYGSRATNGVVMVTTKSAKSGNGKTSISYDGYYGFKNIARMPDFMSGDEWTDYRFMRYTTTAVGSKKLPAMNPVRTMTDGNLGNFWAGNSQQMKDMYTNKSYIDWPSLVTSNGTQQNHFVNIAGAAKNLSYRIGFGYQSEDGVLGDKYDRFNLKGAIDHQLNDYFTAGLSVNMAMTNNDYGSKNAVLNGFRANSYWLPYDVNGDLNYQPGKDSRFPSGFSGTVNPLLDMANSSDKTRTYNVLSNLYLQLTPIKGIILKTTFSPSYLKSRRGEYYGPDTEENAKTRYHTATLTNKETFSYTWDNQINYSHDFGDHNLNAMGLFSIYSSKYEDSEMTADNMPFNTAWWNMGSGSDILNPGSSYSKITMLSYVGRINYSYKGKYLATVSSRWDGSSKFQDGNKWGAFPSMALAWRASEEKFLKNDWLSNLKLRGSYGVTGNNGAVSAYGTQALANTKYWYAFGGNLAGGYGPNGFVNEALTWEKTSELNLGVDFGFFNNRISGSVDWYNKISKDLLMQQDLMLELGAANGSMWNNVGKVKNTGLEVLLRTLNVKTKDWQWETTFTFATNKNKILELNGKKEDMVSDGWFIGQPIDVMYDLQYEGICTAQDLKNNPDLYNVYHFYEGSMKIKDQQKQGESGYGVIDSNDRVVQGHVLPSWTGSFTSSLYYKNFDFSFSIYSKQGSTVYSPFIQEFTDYSDRGRTKLKMDFYVPEGNPTFGGLDASGNTIVNTAGKMGSYPYPDNDQTNNYGGGFGWGNGKQTTYKANNYVDASFIKVKNITVGYTFPKSLISKAKISQLRMYFNVLNPITFTNYKGFDPEWADASLSDGTGGPSTVTYQIGLNLKF